MSADARTVQVTVPADEAELAADALWAAGAAAVEQRPADAAVVLVAGPHAGGDVDALVAVVAGRWPAEVVPVDLGAALDAWRAHARAVRVGPLVVRPPWVPVPAVEEPGGDGPPVDVVVDPGRAFGSGAHASTRLALAALADLVAAGDRVLDVGCGSGVLAVAALRLGAARAVGIDTDPHAVAATRANAARNGVADRLVVRELDAAGAAHVADLPDPGGPADPAGPAGVVPDPAGRYDLVVANLLLPELVTALPAIARAVAPHGAAVVSGILADQVDALVAAAAPAGLAADGAPRVVDGWAALTLRPVGPRAWRHG